MTTEPVESTPETDLVPHLAPAAPGAATCERCAAKEATPAESFVYAIGKLDVRFPSLGIEREFQQREARLGDRAGHQRRGQRIVKVLEANRHLASRVCYLFLLSGVPGYIVMPTSWQLREDVLRAVADSGVPDHWCVLIGRRGPMSTPSTCAGVLAPIVACDQLYAFTFDEWRASLEAAIGPALSARKVESTAFRETARELFDRIVASTENLGASDAQRALNYLVVQHPGIFLAAAERAGKQTLDRIETRLIQGMGVRRLVAVIFTFLDVVTGVPERLFCRVDVTEEWPFSADATEGARAPVGLLPFVESTAWGLPY